MGMFDFFFMADNYEQRKVDNTEVGGGVIDTCEVNDSAKPFETGIAHPDYNDNNWIIVEMYDTREEAKAGHDRWVAKFSGKKLPDSLKDVNTCEIAQFIGMFGADTNKTFVRTKTKNQLKRS